MKKISVYLLAAAMCSSTAYGYENTKAHPAINNAIVTFSETYLAGKLPAQHTWRIKSDGVTYSGEGVINSGFSYATYGEGPLPLTLLQWAEHGGFSADEPELAAAIRHFYDPTGHSAGRKYLTNRGTSWEWLYTLDNLLHPQTDAIEWAMGDTEKGAYNSWSLKEGKKYLAFAFELSDEADKKASLAKAYRCLGEVLHNTADMACPPHVRNDSHAAPLGYDWGALLGSPDPYEELFDPKWAAEFVNGKRDPSLESFFTGATSIRSIHEKLAEFTNRNFFSDQTINGAGYEPLSPINKDGDYPEPRLEYLDYDTNDYTFYHTFPSGNRVKMCKDKRIFVLRGLPYIDSDCAQSQAAELLPNILCAGAHVIRLFLPQFQIQIREAVPDDYIKGQVVHVKSSEYPEAILYSGPIDLIDANTGRSIVQLNCSTGDFIGRNVKFKNGDQLIARITLGGLIIESPLYTVTGPVGTTHDLGFQVRIDGHYLNQVSRPDTSYSYESDSDGATYFTTEGYKGGFAGNTFIGSYTRTVPHIQTNGTITALFSPDRRKIVSLAWTETSTTQYSNKTITCTAANIPLSYSYYLTSIYEIKGEEAGDAIVSLTVVQTASEGLSYTLQSWSTDWNSQIYASLTEQ